MESQTPVRFPSYTPGGTSWRRSFLRILFWLLGIVVLGTAGYRWLEGYSWLEALYMTVITLSTVGYGEVRPLSDTGRAFTIGLILLGVGTAAYLFTTLAEYIVSGELEGTLQRRRWMAQLRSLHQHYLICGFGRMGAQVAMELSALGMPFVVLERRLEEVEQARRAGYLVVAGDPTEEEVLQAAQISKARGLVAVLDTDADNLFLVLTARSLNPDLFIVAQALSEATETKLYKAGADRVVTPFVMAGHRITSLLIRPYVVTFLDAALRSESLELWLEEVRVAPDSPLVGKSLAEADIRAKTGANVLAIARGEAQMDWSPTLRIQPNDVLIILGRREQILEIARLARDERLVRLLSRGPEGRAWARRFPLRFPRRKRE